MLSLPAIKVRRKGTQLEVKVIAEGSIFPTRSEWLERTVKTYLADHPHFTRAEIMFFLLWVLKDKDFVVFSFGSDPLAYVQFIKSGDNLILDFPYSRTLGVRALQVDRVELVLKNHGFTRFVVPRLLSSLHYDDYYNGSFASLEASFGSRRLQLAVDVTLDIAQNVFHLPADCRWEYTLGSQRG